MCGGGGGGRWIEEKQLGEREPRTIHRCYHLLLFTFYFFSLFFLLPLVPALVLRLRFCFFLWMLRWVNERACGGPTTTRSCCCCSFLDRSSFLSFFFHLFACLLRPGGVRGRWWIRQQSRLVVVTGGRTGRCLHSRWGMFMEFVVRWAGRVTSVSPCPYRVGV